MYISFLKNVYFTIGSTKSTISDYNTGNLYHLSRQETAFVQKVVGMPKNMLFLTETEQKDLDYLIEKGILCYSEYVNDGNVAPKCSPDIDFVWIEVTTRCNLRCKHCYDESSAFRSETMSLKDFKYVVNEIAGLGVRRIQIIGGEPLVLGDTLLEMLQYATNYFKSIEVFTNGTLLSDHLIYFFKLHNIKLALSVYSYNPEIHDCVTGVSGSHLLTTQWIEQLAKAGIKFRVANVLMAGVELGKKNTPYYTLNPYKDVVRMCGRGNLSLLTLKLLKCKLVTAESFSTPLNKSLFCRICHGHNCFARRLYISAQLEVFPCVMERRLSHGSLKDAPLIDILKDSIFRMNKDYVTTCKDCEFRYCCHDCRPDSLTNDVYAKPWYCTYNPYLGEWADIDKFIHLLEEKFAVQFN